MKCNRLICIGDGIIYHCDGKYYVAGSAQLDFYECFKGIDEVYLWSRIYNITEKQKEKYARFPFETSTKKFHVVGIYDQPSGITGYIKTFIARYRGMKHLFQESALIVCQPISVSQWMMWYLFRNSKQIYIGRCIGDPDGVKDTKKRFAKQISWMMKHVSKEYYKHCALQTWVSHELENKYAIPERPSVVFHDFLIYGDEISEEVWLSDSKKMNLLFVGRLSEEKGILDLIRAIKMLNNPDIYLTIIGQGTQEKEIKSEIRSAKLDDKICLKGYCSWGDELFSYMKYADCLILPSYNEGLGMVLLEAMANGTAVIASRVGGIPDIVDDEYNGLLFSAGNIDELENRIAILFNDRQLLRRLSENALITARENARERQLLKFKEAYLKYVYEKLSREERN